MRLWFDDGEIETDRLRLAFEDCEQKAAGVLLSLVASEAMPLEDARLEHPKEAEWRLESSELRARFLREDGALRGWFEALDADGEPALRFIERLAHDLNPERVRVKPEDGAAVTLPFDRANMLFHRVLEEEESEFQTIAIAEHPVYGKLLLLNGEVQIADSDESIYSRALARAALPDAASKACVLGGGDCGVLRELLSAGLEAVVMVELDPGVVEACERHFPEVVGGATEDPRAELVFGDAFAYLKETGDRFDLVVYDLSDEPIGDMSDAELVDLMAGILKPGGRLAVQCGSSAEWNRPRREGMVEAIAAHFEGVEIRRLHVPSFSEVPWVIAASGPLRAE